LPLCYTDCKDKNDFFNFLVDWQTKRAPGEAGQARLVCQSTLRPACPFFSESALNNPREDDKNEYLNTEGMADP
jgi:hypothetical protein